MSRIRRKSEIVLEKGKSDRASWSPQLGSAPLRHYMWWRSQTGKYRAQENFCHFWRVVLIWAPLLRLRKAIHFKNRRINWSAVLLAVYALFVYSCIVTMTWSETGWWSFIVAPLLLLAMLAIVLGAIVTLALTVDRVDEAARTRIRKRAHSRAMYTPELQADMKTEPKAPRRHFRDTWLYGALTRAMRPVARFLGSCVDYIVLLAQVVRVKKWKICPIVNIPD